MIAKRNSHIFFFLKMHEFIVVCLKKLFNESGRKQVALKAAAKAILGTRERV